MSEKPALQPRLAVGEALRAVARDILGEARSAIENPAHSDAVAVHEFRRAMKRWRSLLRMLEPFLPDGRQLRNEARDLARSLGGARDAKSALDALDDLVKHESTLSARSLATLRGRIEALRQTAETNVLTPDMRLIEVGREGNKLIAVLKNEYSDQEEERAVDQVVAEHGTLPRDQAYFALKEDSRNRGEIDYHALARNQLAPVLSNPDGKFLLFRVGDALASRNIHAAIYDSLRICKDL